MMLLHVLQRRINNCAWEVEDTIPTSVSQQTNHLMVGGHIRLWISSTFGAGKALPSLKLHESYVPVIVLDLYTFQAGPLCCLMVEINRGGGTFPDGFSTNNNPTTSKLKYFLTFTKYMKKITLKKYYVNKKNKQKTFHICINSRNSIRNCIIYSKRHCKGCVFNRSSLFTEQWNSSFWTMPHYEKREQREIV